MTDRLPHPPRPWLWPTLAGGLAILLWGTLIAVARSAIEQLGAVRVTSYSCILGGLLAFTFLAFRPHQLRATFSLPKKYLLICGLCFTTYMLLLNLSLQLAHNRQQVLEVALLNYLWPGLSLLLSVILFRLKTRYWLIPSIALAVAGAALALLPADTWSPDLFLANLRHHGLPYLLAFAAAIAWAAYGNLARLLAANHQGTPVPIFLTATGLLVALFIPLFPNDSPWTRRAIFELAYITVGPGLLAYALWDFAMRRGRIVLVTTMSFFIPLLSTAVSSLYLHVPAHATLWIGAILLIVGSALCKLAVHEPTESQ
jgi:drug/metabolite transporter (DMT)-like permease